MTAKKRYFLKFPKEMVDEPILFQVGHKFKIITNIRGASVSDGVGRVALEITGEKDEITRAVEWLGSKGITVEEMTGKEPKN